MSDQDSFYLELLDSLADGVYFTDRKGRITFWNKGAEQLSGFSKSEVMGRMCSENILMHVDASGLQLCGEHCPLRAAIQNGKNQESDIFLHHKDGSRVPISVRIAPMKDSSGSIIGAVEVFNDNTTKMQMAERLAQMEQLALLDPLTGLPNRRHLESHLHSRFEEYRRSGWPFGVLFMDVDNFKHVNDHYGHEVGDRILKMIAATLSSNSRYFDIVGRWGGEEFVAVIHNIDQQNLKDIAERWRMLVERSTLTDLESLRVTISLGGAQITARDTAETILQRADANLYTAKRTGKNRVCLDTASVEA